jgi:hypothetical protein
MQWVARIGRRSRLQDLHILLAGLRMRYVSWRSFQWGKRAVPLARFSGLERSKAPVLERPEHGHIGQPLDLVVWRDRLRIGFHRSLEKKAGEQRLTEAIETAAGHVKPDRPRWMTEGGGGSIRLGSWRELLASQPDLAQL